MGCCAPGCDTGYEKERKKRKTKCVQQQENASLFKVRAVHLKSFAKIIESKRANFKLKVGDLICSLHFYETDIERSHGQVVMPDGKVVDLGPRDKPHLKDDAVPRLFPGCPEHMSKVEKKRKSPKKRQPLLEQDNNKRKLEEEENNLPEDPIELEDSLTFHSMILPNRAWAVHEVDKVITICKMSRKLSLTHIIEIDNETIVIKVNGQLIRGFPSNLKTLVEYESLVNRIDALKLCEGADLGEHSEDCWGWVTDSRAVRCTSCKVLKRRIRRRKRRDEVKERKVRREAIKSLRRSLKRVKSKFAKVRKRVEYLHKKCQQKKREELKKEIEMLPINQQVVVMTCFRAAKCKSKYGMRYVADWIYQCLLMRIKSPTLYEHIQIRNILPLPSRTLLNTYMKNLRPCYGYQNSLFNVLKTKTENWSEMERHGTILIDEVKLQPGLDFDRNILELWGFVDMGKFTPDNLKHEMGDHALVVLFQPFKGGWIQSLGCFLAKGNVKGDILAKIVLEGIMLCENSGLKVDGVVSDGGQWNRVMWREFGISESSPDTVHPYDPERKLWFFSDWCHLLKCMRNTLCPEQPRSKKTKKNVNENNPGEPPRKKHKGNSAAAAPPPPAAPPCLNSYDPSTYIQKTLQTPDGTVKRIHWVSVWNEEKKKFLKSQLRYVPKLNESILFPTGFEKMNVGMAFTFFSHDMQVGMKMYRDFGIEELKDCQPTLILLDKVRKVAKAMNSGGSSDGFRRGSKAESAIEDFLTYHEQCIQKAKAAGKKSFWSESTDLGLQVSLKSALKLSHYLIDKVGFRYIMTKRFNQDALEHFFGNIRQMAAPNPHPDPKLFAQLHRLLSIYSLISPAKKSNVSGVECVEALTNAKDTMTDKIKDKREGFDELIDEILEFGTPLDCLPVQVYKEHAYSLDVRKKYDELLTSFMAGFTAFRQKKLAQGCSGCLASLVKPRSDIGPKDKFTVTKECYGGLTYPSPELVNLVESIEKAVGDCVSNHDVHKDMVYTTLKYLVIDAGCFVGCLDHKDQLTKRILKYYLFVRMYFAAGIKNQQQQGKEKQRRIASRKKSKL